MAGNAAEAYPWPPIVTCRVCQKEIGVGLYCEEHQPVPSGASTPHSSHARTPTETARADYFNAVSALFQQQQGSPQLQQGSVEPTQAPSGHHQSASFHRIDDLETAMSQSPSFLSDLPTNSRQSNQLPQNATTSSNTMNGNAGPGGAGPAMGAPGAGVNIFPTAAGHQMDLNHLWSIVQELSAQLKENRDSTQHIVGRVAELRRRAEAGEGGMSELLRAVNGDENARNVAELHTRIDGLTATNAALDNECNELSVLVGNYEAGVGKILEMVRNYSYEHNQALNGTHRYYMNELARERQENINLQQQHFETQAGLRKVAGILREGIRQSDEELDQISIIAGLRRENRCLRQLVGWPVEDEEEEQGEGST
ncbi:MAG: hypothetical protein M1837_003549 [Sclerophora amabilis]|nr:MAG: hypothetical protein M1837_003549 [Sclerophora amabilis]